MKRFLILALLGAFILGTVGVAQAVEIKAKGTWRVHFDVVDNPDFSLIQQATNKRSEYDRFLVGQRARTIFEFIASENLKGVLQLEIGNLRWGGPNGGTLNTDGTNVKTKHAYLNFKLPGTAVDIRAGLQPVALPSTLGSHILSADVGALVANVPFNDMIGLTLGYARAFDLEKFNEDDITKKLDDEVDVFLAVLPVTMDGLSVTPFMVYSRWGKDFQASELFGGPFDKNANMYHAGVNFAVTMLDPIAFLGDFNYGTVKWDDNYKQSGWIADLAVQYAMDMVTPQLFFAYESGEGSDYITGGDSKRMPVIGTDGGAFGPGIGYGQQTAFMQDNFVRGLLMVLDVLAIGTGSNASLYQTNEGAVGLWAAGAALRNITFMEGLSHELVAYYAKGTNANENLFLMTKKDSYYEIDFNTTWQMYENLALIAELAYGKVKLDDHNTGFRGDLVDKALKRASVGFLYKF